MSGTPTEAERHDRARRIVAHMLSNDPFSQWLGVEVLHVAPGSATLRMTVRPEMANGFGRTHGGITYSFADSAFAFASNGHGRIAVSVDSQIAHTRAVQAGDVLEAVAVEEQLTERLGFYRVQVTSAGSPVALFRGTVYRTKQHHPGVDA
jgi:acyl-CoA thioesterase